MNSRRSPAARIVIVTPKHLCNNPRAVKEADALSAAGFDVHVVFGQCGPDELRQRDEGLLNGRAWSWSAVRCSRRRHELFRWAFTTTRQRAFGLVPPALWNRGYILERAAGRIFPELARMAASRHAALYIGHYPEGLAAAAAAAREVGAKLAFDAEDFHTGEPEGGDDLIHVDSLQRRYLPLCDYVTAGSVGIANALTREYGIRPPTAIYNVFPLQDRERLDGLTRDRCGDYLSLYWYSQVIGLDRGIQDAIRAAGLLKGPVQIHLRGIVNGDVREALLGLAHECGVADYVYFHDVVPPGELLSRTAEHDVGLALEDGSVYNRAICTTNKLFFYMLAGLAVAATAVPGQAAVLSGNTTAAAIYPARDYERLAGILEAWRVDRARLSRAKAAAAQWAEERWNWENESAKLVAIVSRTMGERSKNMATFAETRVS